MLEKKIQQNEIEITGLNPSRIVPQNVGEGRSPKYKSSRVQDIHTKYNIQDTGHNTQEPLTRYKILDYLQDTRPTYNTQDKKIIHNTHNTRYKK